MRPATTRPATPALPQPDPCPSETLRSETRRAPASKPRCGARDGGRGFEWDPKAALLLPPPTDRAPPARTARTMACAYHAAPAARPRPPDQLAHLVWYSCYCPRKGRLLCESTAPLCVHPLCRHHTTTTLRAANLVRAANLDHPPRHPCPAPPRGSLQRPCVARPDADADAPLHPNQGAVRGMVGGIANCSRVVDGAARLVLPKLVPTRPVQRTGTKSRLAQSFLHA